VASEDRTKHFRGISTAPEAEVEVPNTVSRNLRTGDRSFSQVITSSGKPVLDAEFNLFQDAAGYISRWMRSYQGQSGWLRGASRHDAYCDYWLEHAPPEMIPGSVGSSVGSIGSIGSVGDSCGAVEHILPDGTLVDAFVLPTLDALVAGYPVRVEFTETCIDGYNLIVLEPARIYDGTNATVKRTDFVFLEVWLSLVAPSPQARAFVEVADTTALADGDQIVIDGIPLTGRLAGPLGPDEFLIDLVDASITAANIAASINNQANSFASFTSARSGARLVQLMATEPGSIGNVLTLGVITAVVGSLSVSGAFYSGGEDRPNKPEQDKLYRHGNVLSPPFAWLPDELVDSILQHESTQRVQIQYRIRATGTAEAVNFKAHPDGFSTPTAGPPPGAAIYAQGGRSGPVEGYPFVPADGQSAWMDSDASTYETQDDGLWIAGDGSETSAQELGALDGYVYAIPLCFVFRHNNASDPLAAVHGFDPVNNTNAAPSVLHEGYNGILGVIPAGESDRPDGKYCDVINTNNMLDLRRHVCLTSIDFKGQLQYQMQSLLDGSIRTWAIDAADKQTLGHQSGDVSTRFLVCNEVGRLAADGGNPPFTGNTGRGTTIRNFDHVCRRFADQPVVERVVFAFWPGDRPTAGAQGGPAFPGTVNPGKYVVKAESGGVPISTDSWYEGDTLHLDLTQLDASTLGGIFQGLTGGGSSAIGLPDPSVAGLAPLGTTITDVLSVYHDDGHFDLPMDQQAQPTLIQGIGTHHLEITLDANDVMVTGGMPISGPNPEHRMVGSDVLGVPDTDGSKRRIFLEVELTYPIGAGTTDTPDHEIEPDPVVYDGTGQGPGPIIETSTSQRPSDFNGLLAPRFREGFREVGLEYLGNDTNVHGPGNVGSPIGSILPEEIVSKDQYTLHFPRRVFGAGGFYSSHVTVVDLAGAGNRQVDPSLTEYGSSSRKVVLSMATPMSGAGHTLGAIQYFAQDPIPNYGVAGAGYQVGAYFRTNAPQTAGTKEGDILTTGDGVLPTLLRVEPLLMSDNLWTGQVGMGSTDAAFPYAAPLDQVPINDGTSATTKEWFFTATASTSIDDFNADTGLLALHAFVQADGQNVLDLGGYGLGEPPRKDGEFRSYYPFADDEAYRPTIMSQPLSGATRHKVFTPFLARIVEDQPGVEGGLLFRRNEVVLVVLSRFAELDDENTVRFIDPTSSNRTAAGIYRTRNLLLIVGDRLCRDV